MDFPWIFYPSQQFYEMNLKKLIWLLITRVLSCQKFRQKRERNKGIIYPRYSYHVKLQHFEDHGEEYESRMTRHLPNPRRTTTSGII